MITRSTRMRMGLAVAATLFAVNVVRAAPLPIGSVSGTAPSGLSWASIATGTALPVVVGGVQTATPGATLLWNVRNGQLQLNPNGLNLNTFNIVYTTGTDTVSASTPGPLSYPQGTSPSTLQVSGTASLADQRAMPAGTWNSLTLWNSRLGGNVARTATSTPTLATSGFNTASTNGWLNQTWSFPSTLVASGSAASMTVSDWRAQGVAGSPNANVVGYGDYQSTFTYSLSGTSQPGTQVGAVIPTGFLALEWAAGTGTWDHTATNWEDPGLLPQKFYNGDTVTFSAASGGTVTVSGTQAPGATTVSAASGTFTFTGDAISGYGGLTKSGGGTAVFASANSWTGGTTLAAGTIRAGNDSALGTGAITASGGTIASADSSARTFGNDLVVSGSLTVGDGVGTGQVLFAGDVDLAGGNRTLTTVSDTSLLGAVSNGSLTKAGAGRLDVIGSASLTGTTALNAGTTVVTSVGSLASSDITVASGAKLSVEGLVQTFGGALAVAGTLEGEGTIAGSTVISGVHAPGVDSAAVSVPGVQTFAGDISYQQVGIVVPRVEWELSANTNVQQAPSVFDQIVVQNNLTFANPTDVELRFNGTGSSVDWTENFWDQPQTWVLYDVGGTTTGAGNARVATTPWVDSQSQDLLSLRPRAQFLLQQQGANVLVSYVPTPEPSTWAMAAIGAAVAGLGRWRRSRRRG